MAYGFYKVWQTESFLESSLEFPFIKCVSPRAAAKNQSPSVPLSLYSRTHTHNPLPPCHTLSLNFFPIISCHLCGQWPSPESPGSTASFSLTLSFCREQPLGIRWTVPPFITYSSHDGQPCQDQYHVFPNTRFLVFWDYSWTPRHLQFQLKCHLSKTFFQALHSHPHNNRPTEITFFICWPR